MCQSVLKKYKPEENSLLHTLGIPLCFPPLWADISLWVHICKTLRFNNMNFADITWCITISKTQKTISSIGNSKRSGILIVFYNVYNIITLNESMCTKCNKEKYQPKGDRRIKYNVRRRNKRWPENKWHKDDMWHQQSFILPEERKNIGKVDDKGMNTAAEGKG